MAAASQQSRSELFALNLTDRQREQIKALHRIRLVWNLVALGYFAAWGAAAYLMIAWPSWVTYAIGYPVIGIAVHALAILMHDAIHGNLFRNRTLDRWVGLALGIPNTMTFSGYGIPHMQHHRYLRTDRDPDEILNITESPVRRQIAFYAWILCGMVYYTDRLSRIAGKLGNERQVAELKVEQRIKLGVQAAAIALSLIFGFFYELLHVWVLPSLLFGTLFGNIRGWAEHWTTEPGAGLLHRTRTVTSTPLVSFLNCNLNYHLEHHLFPGVPWYNLQKVHHILLPAYRRLGVEVESSYLRLLWRIFRSGLPGADATPVRAA